MDLNLKESRVLVTGSTKGIGLQIASSFLDEGASVIVTGRSISCFISRPNSYKYEGDLLQESKIGGLSQFVLDTFGELDHVVCNIGSGVSVPPGDETYDGYLKMMTINLNGTVQLIKKVLSMIQASHSKNKTITLVGSICGVENLGCPTGYMVAKAGLIAYSKSLSKVLGKENIRVNVVSPGNVLFQGSSWEKKIKKDKEAVYKMISEAVSLQRFGSPDDIANMVMFLASDRASFITGANYIVDGGQTRSF
ncbi:SDR family oxidoreductase [bacterium]|jgi:3-oxoacyl-[acyl-carrier protein] reductase|nr:SDR family oxidoreductase [bacterium]